MKSYLTLIAALCISLSSIYSQGDVEINKSAEYKFDFPKSRRVIIPAAAFTTAKEDLTTFVSDTTSFRYKFFRGGLGTGRAWAAAPVRLPHLATITSITGWIYDNEVARTADLELWRVSLSEMEVGRIVVGINTDDLDASTDIREIRAEPVLGSPVIVTNNTHEYYLVFETNNANTEDLRLYGARIQYTVMELE